MNTSALTIPRDGREGAEPSQFCARYFLMGDDGHGVLFTVRDGVRTIERAEAIRHDGFSSC